jgi:hypothetical protein
MAAFSCIVILCMVIGTPIRHCFTDLVSSFSCGALVHDFLDPRHLPTCMAFSDAHTDNAVRIDPCPLVYVHRCHMQRGMQSHPETLKRVRK